MRTRHHWHAARNVTRAAGDLELMTGSSRCSDCISSGSGVFCALLLIPAEVSASGLTCDAS